MDAMGLLVAIPMTVGISFGPKAAAVVFTTYHFPLFAHAYIASASRVP